jgi:hypothetical protein
MSNNSPPPIAPSKLRSLWFEIRDIFHWKYSQAVAPVIFGIGLALAIDNDFAWAIMAFVFFGTWSIFVWLEQDSIKERYRSLQSRKIQKDKQRRDELKKSIAIRQWSGVIVLLCITAVCIYLTESKKQQYKEKIESHQREEVFQKLAISVSSSDNLSDSIISVTNNGSTTIRHMTVLCIFNGLMDVNHNFLQGGNREQIAAEEELRPGGDTESSNCIGHLVKYSAGPKCGDMTVSIKYFLETQPTIEQEKRLRFMARPEFGKAVWHGVAVNHTQSYCTPNQ